MHILTILLSLLYFQVGASRQGSPFKFAPEYIVMVKGFSPSELSCVIVHSSGEYRLERVSVAPGGAPKQAILETHLRRPDLDVLRHIIDSPEFFKLHSPSEFKGAVAGKVYMFSVPRWTGLQTYTTPDSSKEAPPKPAQTLLEWIEATNAQTTPARRSVPQCGVAKVAKQP